MVLHRPVETANGAEQVRKSRSDFRGFDLVLAVQITSIDVARWSVVGGGKSLQPAVGMLYPNSGQYGTVSRWRLVRLPRSYRVVQFDGLV
jgi:hypothetical protein